MLTNKSPLPTYSLLIFFGQSRGFAIVNVNQLQSISYHSTTIPNIYTPGFFQSCGGLAVRIRTLRNDCFFGEKKKITNQTKKLETQKSGSLKLQLRDCLNLAKAGYDLFISELHEIFLSFSEFSACN